MVKRLDKWCDNLWIYCMCIMGAASFIFLIVNWSTLPLGAKGAVFAMIIMPLHVVEEWKFPGGLHYIYNILFWTSKSKTEYLDRYPMSRFTDMLTNVGLELFPLLFLVLSLKAGLSTETALCMAIFSFLEVGAHTLVGFYSLKRYSKYGKRTIYDPGLGTSYLMFLPVGIYLVMNMPALTMMNWVGAITEFVVMCLSCIAIAEWPFRQWVLKQEDGAFAFENPKYYSKFVSKDNY